MGEKIRFIVIIILFSGLLIGIISDGNAGSRSSVDQGVICTTYLISTSTASTTITTTAPVTTVVTSIITQVTSTVTISTTGPGPTSSTGTNPHVNQQSTCTETVTIIGTISTGTVQFAIGLPNDITFTEGSVGYQFSVQITSSLPGYYEIYDSFGQLIQTAPFNDSIMVTIKLENLPPGIHTYQIFVFNQNGDSSSATLTVTVLVKSPSSEENSMGNSSSSFSVSSSITPIASENDDQIVSISPFFIYFGLAAVMFLARTRKLELS